MGEFVENSTAENSALRRKLQSKVEALLILTQELDQCRTERDQYKLMINQLSFKSGLSSNHNSSSQDGWCAKYSLTNSSSTILKDLKEQNKLLRIDVENLKQKLKDAEGDIKVLRSGNSHSQGGAGKKSETNSVLPTHQREELIEQLEGLNMKCEHLQNDLQTVLDEKEELVVERDAYRCKVHRLNHEMNTLLSANPNKLIDVDGLIMENKYLHERLEHILEEKGLATQSLSKYKSMLDSKRDKSCMKLGTISASGKILTYKQVQHLLEKVRVGNFLCSETTLADLRSLCLTLLESVQDKSLVISHFKKTNKALARRIADLEERLESTGEKTVAIYPSRLLLDGYASAQVDKDGIVDDVTSWDKEKKRSVHNQSSDSKSNDFLSSGDQIKPRASETSENESIDSLSPELQKLVQQALKDLENDTESKQEATQSVKTTRRNRSSD